MNKQELIEEIKKHAIYHCGEKECYKEGCTQVVDLGVVLGLVKQLDEPQPAKVPQCVADFIAEQKKLGHTLSYSIDASMSDRVAEWYWDNSKLFARAWLDGYEVEAEKRYKVVMLNVSSSGGVLTCIKHDDSWIWIDTLGTIVEGRTHTRKELEEAGFGWVFSCEGIEIEEVE